MKGVKGAEETAGEGSKHNVESATLPLHEKKPPYLKQANEMKK